MATTPRVTLGVMTFNNEQYLAGALDGVLAQDYRDFEVVVCDNQSTDSTWDIVQRYAAKDERFRVFRNEKNLGFSGNYNRLVSHARGEFFRLTAHDDLMAPTLLSRCVEALDAYPKAVLAYPQAFVIDGEGEVIAEWEDVGDLVDPRSHHRISTLVRDWRLCNEIFGLIRTDVLRRTRGYSPYSSTDMRMLVELAARGEFRQVPERLFYRRVHAASSFQTDRAAGSGEHMRWLEPEVSKTKKLTRKHDRTGGDYTEMSLEATRALLTSEQPLGQRLRNGATFATVFQYRRSRIFLGAWRRRIVGRPDAPPPWEAARGGDPDTSASA